LGGSSCDGAITEERKVEAIRLVLERVKRYRADHKMNGYFIEVEVESLKQASPRAKFHREEVSLT